MPAIVSYATQVMPHYLPNQVTMPAVPMIAASMLVATSYQSSNN